MPEDKKLAFSLIQVGDINVDLKSASKAVIKLIEVVGNGVGKWWESRHAVRAAEAEVRAALIKAEGAAAVRELGLRTGERLYHQEMRRQGNIEAITAGALRELPKDVSDRPVHPDWVAQFFDLCQDVGDEKMQTLWSRLLAGEVAEPETFSPRALWTVKTLRPADANLFTRYCSFVVQIGSNSFCRFKTEEIHAAMARASLMVNEILALQDLGLVSPTMTKISMESGQLNYMHYFGQRYLLRGTGYTSGIVKPILGIESLTRVGAELAQISGAQVVDGYIDLISKFLPEYGIMVKREE